MPTVKIRLQKLSDAKRLYEILNNDNFIYFGTRPKSVVDERKWLEDAVKRRKENISHHWTIMYGKEIVGGIGVKINYHRKYIGEIGYCVNEKYWGRGIATQAVQLIEKICFKKLKLLRIEIVMQPKNVGSVKVAIKNGYKREGLMRKAVKGKDGKMKDCYLYSKVL